MWLMTQHGFFSIVQHHENPDEFLVRARVKNDLINLLNLTDLKHEIASSRSSHYPHRIYISGVELLHIFQKMGQKINYSDFEKRIGELEDQSERLPLYYDVSNKLTHLKETEKAAVEETDYFKREGLQPVSLRDIDLILTHLPILQIGQMSDEQKQAFWADLNKTGFPIVFDWPEWANTEGENYISQPELFQSAGLMTIRKYFFACIRADRMTESMGSYGGWIDTQSSLEAIKRLQVIRDSIQLL